MEAPQHTVVVREQTDQHAFIVRAIWYLFVGWWLSALTIIVGYLLIVSIVFSPLGAKVLNYVPQALTLRRRTANVEVIDENGVIMVGATTVPQRPLWQRAIYFVLIGWWFGAVWIAVGWALCAILLGFPLGIWMLNRIGAVISLHRH